MDFTWAGRPGILTSAKEYLETYLSIREHDAICDRLTTPPVPDRSAIALRSNSAARLRRTVHERAPLAPPPRSLLPPQVYLRSVGNTVSRYVWKQGRCTELTQKREGSEWCISYICRYVILNTNQYLYKTNTIIWKCPLGLPEISIVTLCHLFDKTKW